MLGVRREGVTEAALKLQRAGLILYSRGHAPMLLKSSSLSETFFWLTTRLLLPALQCSGPLPARSWTARAGPE